MKKVLVTGAAGFIGQYTLPLLVEKGYQVHAVDLKQSLDNIEGVIWHEVDLLDKRQIDDLIDKVKPTHLLHFAWYVVPGNFYASVENLEWVKSSLDLFLSFVRNGGRRIVAAGTCAEYDWQTGGFCREEITPINPHSLYGVCKDALRKIVQFLCYQEKVEFAWGRIFFLYGPCEKQGRLIPAVICSLLKNKKFKCIHGSKVRDFLYVEDVASAFVNLLDSDIQGIVNIASGEPVTLGKIISQVGEQLGRGELIEFEDDVFSLDNPASIVGDSSRLKKELGWRPSIDFSEGIRRTILWWKNKL